MKKITLLMLSLILSVGAMAQVDELLDKKISAIEAATEIEAESWYLLKNMGRDAYISEETNAMMMRDPAVVGDFARQKAGLLFKVTKNGDYYNIMSGNGLYFSLGDGSAPISKESVNFVIKLITSNGNTNCFYFNDATTGYVANGNYKDNTFVGWGKDIPTTTTANSAYQFLKVTFEEVELEKVIYTFTLNGETKYTQSQWCEAGQPFPDYTIASYHALTIPAKPTEMVSATNCEQTIVMSVEEDEIPFKLSTLTNGEFGNDMHWYTMTLSGTDLTCNDFVTPAANVSKKTPKNLYAFTGNPYDGYKIYNMYMGASKVLWSNWFDNSGNPIPMTAVEDVTPGTDWLLNVNGNGYGLKRNGTNTGYVNKRNGNFSYWNSGAAATDGNSRITFTEVTSINDFVANYKAEALATLDQWATLSVVFDANLIASAKTAINAINTNSYATSAEIDAEIKKVTDAVAAKMFTFQTLATDNHRENVWVSANPSTGKAIGLHGESNYNSIWSLRHAGGVSFYMFNELNQVYMGAPSANCPLTETPSVAYTFEIIDAANGVVEMKCNGETMHASNHTDDKLLNWDGDEAASRWYIKTIDVAADIKAILDGLTENDYADVPALGQYTTAAYEALDAARTNAKTIEEVEHAIAAFKKAKNRPVFTISGTKDYVVGKSMYENEGKTNAKGNDLYFKTTNKYDKTMWWVFDQASTTVGVTESVAVVNYATGNPIWGVENLKITETSENDTKDGVFLFYTVGNDTPLHFQADGALITRWSSTEKTSGSAATFTYVGNTYDLDKLTDGHIEALSNLQVAYDNKASFANAVLGDELGQYKGSKDALVSAVAAAKEIIDATVAQQAAMTVENINAAATALNDGAAALTINLPAAGKYYRIQGACEASLPGYYITGHTNADGGRIALTAEADASTIYYFDGTNLIAYQSGLVIGLNKDHWTFASVDDNSKPASTITFAQSPRTVGAYTVNSADRYFHYTVYNGTVQVNRCADDVCKEHDWYLTEVTSLPVTITDTKYATFYAPVAVTVPEGVTAHTVTVDGEWAKLSEESLRIIPANTGVVLVGNEDSYNFAVTTASAFEGENLMSGTIAKTLVTKPDNTECYVLAKPEGAEVAAMYIAVNGEEETTFYNAGHKAYLEVDKTVAEGISFYGFRGDDEEGTTAIENVEVVTEDVIFDLSGRRVSEITAPGIYIVNGKKVIK